MKLVLVKTLMKSGQQLRPHVVKSNFMFLTVIEQICVFYQTYHLAGDASILALDRLHCDRPTLLYDERRYFM